MIWRTNAGNHVSNSEISYICNKIMYSRTDQIDSDAICSRAGPVDRTVVFSKKKEVFLST